MKNLPHEIIEYLFKNYHKQIPNVVLNPILEKINTNIPEKIFCNKIKDILTAFETKGFISWEVSKENKGLDRFYVHSSYKNEFGTEVNSIFNGLTNNHILAKLTPSGLDYAIDIDRNRVQHRNNNLAIIFSAATVIITLTTLCIEIKSHRSIKKEEQELKNLIRIQDSAIDSNRIEINFLIEEIRKDSIKKTVRNK